MFKDWKKAVWRAPLHLLASIPIAAASVVIPPLGTKYVNWRTKAESNDVITNKDTPEKATIDLYSQTILVRTVLKLW